MFRRSSCMYKLDEDTRNQLTPKGEGCEDDASFASTGSTDSVVEARGLLAPQSGGAPTPAEDSALSDRGLRILSIAKQYRRLIIERRDPWRDFAPSHPLRGRRLLYDARRHAWVSEPAVVELGREAFDRGELRECFKMRELRGQELQELQSSPLELVAHLARRSLRTCWVAKRYLDDDNHSLHKQDVAMQMVAKSYAEAFDSLRLRRIAEPEVPRKWKDSCKPVDFLMSHLLELDGCQEAEGAEGGPDISVPWPPGTSFAVEAFVYGKYEQYNTITGDVGGNRQTPQAFSHFTWEHSERTLVCVDLQGVDDLYTKPTVHSPSKFLWCDTNLGFRGMALFFWSHRCNDACRLMHLSPFPTYADQVVRAKAAAGDPLRVREMAHGALTKSDSELSSVRQKAGIRTNRLQLEQMLLLRDSDWLSVPVVRHPRGRGPVPRELVEPCIHMELTWLYARGRLSAGQTAQISPEGALFHLQQAAKGGLACALLALARLCSDFPHEDFLPSVLGCSGELCLHLLELAADRGSTDAAGSLAQLAEHGTYEDADFEKAARMYEHFARLHLEEDSGEEQQPEADQAAAGSDEKGRESSAFDAPGIARPTFWGNTFGWDSHGLTPHSALAAAARLHGELSKRAKAAELYGWAAEVAMEAGQPKAAARYEQLAASAEAEGWGEGSASLSTGSRRLSKEGTSEQMALAQLPATLLARLEVLAKELDAPEGDEGVRQAVEQLLKSYRGSAPERRQNLVAPQPVGLRSILKKSVTFSQQPPEEFLPRFPDEDETHSFDRAVIDKVASSSQEAPLAKVPPEALPAAAAAPRARRLAGAEGALPQSPTAQVEVADSSGRPLRGATVVLVDGATGDALSEAAVTDAAGKARVRARRRRLLLRVTRPGYRPSELRLDKCCSQDDGTVRATATD